MGAETIQNTSCQIDGEKVEAVADFSFLVSKITADMDCSLEIKRLMLLAYRVIITLFLTISL